MNIITQIDPTKQGVYPLDHKYDILKNIDSIDQIRVLNWGVKKKLPLIPSKHVVVKIDRKTDGISLSAKKRLIKITSAMEQFEVKVSHMITFTLPRQRWEAIPNDQKATVWLAIKRKILRALEKLLSRYSKETSNLWFQEFQEKNGRGAPHLHVLVNIGRLSDTEWHKMLKRLIHIWKNSLNWNDKDGEFPSQSVDFGRMKKSDFRYARKYASKTEQKNAPFKANWGNWWGRGGVWKKIKIHDYSVNLNLLSNDDQDKLLKVFRNNTWLTWGMLNYRNKDLHDKLQKILLLPFDYNQEGRGSATGKAFYERFKQVITEDNKKDDAPLSNHIVSLSFPTSQIIQQSPTPCQEATNPCQEPVKNIEKSNEKAVQTSNQLRLDITPLERYNEM